MLKTVNGYDFLIESILRNIPNILLLIDTGTEYGRGLLRGIARYSLLHGPWAFYWGEPFYRRSQKNLLSDVLKKWKPQGIIIRDTEYLEKDFNTKIPVVYAVDSADNFSNLNKSLNGFFTCDWFATGKMAAEYLFNRGFRRFAYCGYEGMNWSDERGKAFGETVSKLGYSTHIYSPTKKVGSNTWNKELPEISEWLAHLPKPIGLMACNDDRAQQIIEACKSANIQVPDEIAILGVDNDELICTLCTPQLSSINLNPEQTGYQVGEMLDRFMTGEKLDNPIVIDKPTHVESRQSTDILAIEDKKVSEAIRFIRLNSKKMIQVIDVVEKSGIARRTLELRFRNSVGHSINTEIKKNKTSLICQMLSNTNWPITRIAMELGFTGVDHIARFFRSEKKMTPSEFRRVYHPQKNNRI